MVYINRHRKTFIFLLVIIISFLFLYLNNNIIVVTNINYINEKIPDSFSNYKIVHISDLHNKEFGKNQRRLLNKIDKIKPDIIVITGDIVDMNKYNMDVAIDFVNGAKKIANVYYVSGNHEASLDYEYIREELINAGAIVLDNEIENISYGNEEIEIIGVADPELYGMERLEKTIREYKDEDMFQILLSHRPEIFDLYSEVGIDLVLSGHAHGGQFRIPFLGGIVSPNQGLLPKYTSGKYVKDNTTLVVSRGLGNSIIPVRFFNLPEIVVISLNSR